MYKMKLTIPRITEVDILKLEETFPGFKNVNKVKPIRSEEEASKVVVDAAHKLVSTYEYVSKILNVTATETGWDFELQMGGD